MRRRHLLGAAIAAAWPALSAGGVSAGHARAASAPVAPVPPVTPKRPLRIEQLGRVRIDDYAWLRDPHYKEFIAGQRDIDPEIRRHLEAENAYADAVLAPTRASQASWRAAMARYGVEPGTLPPLPRGGFVYDTRVRPGEDHVVHVRRPLAGGPEQILLDEQARSRGQSYYRVLEAQPSPDHTLYVWLEDVHGSDRYRICVHDLRTGEIRSWEDGYGWSGLTVSPDSQWIFWTWRDPFGRAAKAFRTPARGEIRHTLVLEQPDPTLFMALGRTASDAWCTIRVFGPDLDEWRLIAAAAPTAEPVLMQAREPGLHYQVDDWGGGLVVLTDAAGALDGQLMLAAPGALSREDWTPLRPAREGVNILELRAFRDHLAWRQRERGRLAVVVRNRAGDEFLVAFGEAASDLEFDDVQDFDGTELRLVFQSPRTPPRWVGVDLRSGERRVLAETRVAGFDPARYEVRRLQATADDGESVPITLLTRRGLRADGRAPLLVYGYGAYGVSSEPVFSVPAIALVDRGWAYAIAHVRGGAEKGRRWFLDGRRFAKRNSFTDFNACTDHLVAAGYGAPARCVAYGLSAGGLLMGGAMNLRPDRYAGVIAQVPFVDMLNTMSDPTHPLVPVFRADWGDPLADGRAYDYLASISPYENVTDAAYPMVLATAGLRDDRVSYWEPAKWVAKLRANTRSGKPILLRVNMAGGHQSSSGASDVLGQMALFWAFAQASVTRPSPLLGPARDGPARDSG
jgi:oligopeptidase B